MCSGLGCIYIYHLDKMNVCCNVCLVLYSCVCDVLWGGGSIWDWYLVPRQQADMVYVMFVTYSSVTMVIFGSGSLGDGRWINRTHTHVGVVPDHAS